MAANRVQRLACRWRPQRQKHHRKEQAEGEEEEEKKWILAITGSAQFITALCRGPREIAAQDRRIDGLRLAGGSDASNSFSECLIIAIN